MRGLFAITKAEFIKIFKKPTVYIMAFVLVLCCVLSLFLYSPTNRNDFRVKLSDENATINYNLFMQNTGADNKGAYDKTINTANISYDYVSKIQQLNKEISYAVINFSNAVESLTTTTPVKKEKLIEFLQTINNCYTPPAEGDVLNNVPYYTYLTTLKNIKGDVIFTKDQAVVSSIISQTNSLISNNATNEDLQNYFIINKSVEKLNTAKNNYVDYINVVIGSVLTDLGEEHKNFINTIQQDLEYGSSQLSEKQDKHLNNIKTLIVNYKTIIDKLTEPSYPIGLMDKEDYEAFIKNYTRVYKLIEKVEKTKEAGKGYAFKEKKECATALSTDSYKAQFNTAYKQLTFVDVNNSDTLEHLKNYKEQTAKNAEVIFNKIVALKNEGTTTNICEQITNYKMLSVTYNQLVSDTMTQLISQDLSNSQIKNLHNYELKDYNEYQIKERISSNEFCLKENKYLNTYLTPFTFNTASEFKTNMYDYMYFSIKICMLLIVIFTMFMLASILSAEQDQGTIKLLLVRPFNRGKILSAKMLAIFFFSLCFLALSTIISAVGGYFMFGLPQLSEVLLIFNGTTTFTLAPIWVMALFLLSCILDIVFYLILATLLSVCFKSYIGSVTTSLIVVVVSMVVSIFLTNTPIYAFMPFTCISLFRFFGNAFVPTGSEFINYFFLTPISSGMSIYSSILISGLFSIIIYIVAFQIFRKRDF